MAHTHHFLERFFNPASVAIVGATGNPFKINYRLLQNIVNLGYKGKIYPVNPKAEEILGVKAFARLQDIPDPVDLVVSAVPPQKTLNIVKDCIETGVENLVIVTGGFSEGGEKGKELHEEISALVKENGIRLLGPNTLTPTNTANNFAISYNPIKKLNRGDLSFGFQSGFYEPMINWVFSHLPINKMLDMGNKMDINELDALEYFAQDPDTRVIAMHIESLHGDAREFLNLLKTTARKKPIIILKSGRTSAGSRAAASHTGTMARENDAVFDAALRQAGVIRARNIEEFFDFAKAFQFLTPPQGDRLAIITLSGGEGVMATDTLETYGFRQAGFSDKTRRRLKTIFPQWEIPLNPLDGGVCLQLHYADLPTYFDTLLAIPEDEGVDCTIFQMLSWASRDIMKEPYVEWLLRLKEKGKPFALWCSSLGADEMSVSEEIETYRVPVFRSSERAVKALAAMNRYRLQTLPRD
ncbi:acetate--CoA ligase family protein [Thermodesulfobacteriota bacterium]